MEKIGRALGLEWDAEIGRCEQRCQDAIGII